MKNAQLPSSREEFSKLIDILHIANTFIFILCHVIKILVNNFQHVYNSTYSRGTSVVSYCLQWFKTAGWVTEGHPACKEIYIYISLSIFMAIFLGGPGLAGTRMSPFRTLLEIRMMEVVVTTATRRRAMLQSQCHHQQTNTQFFTGSMPVLSPDQQCQSTEGNLTSVKKSLSPSSIICYRHKLGK